MHFRKTACSLLSAVTLLLAGPALWGQEGEGDVALALADARGELMRLPPLQDLLKVASKTAPRLRTLDLAQQKEDVRASLWQLENWNVLNVQGAAIAGRRDIFSVNSDGQVYVPRATVVDNVTLNGAIALKVNPVTFLKSKRQVEILALERLGSERDVVLRDVAEGVIYTYNMGQKAIDLMDVRTGIKDAIAAMAPGVHPRGVACFIESEWRAFDVVLWELPALASGRLPVDLARRSTRTRRARRCACATRRPLRTKWPISRSAGGSARPAPSGRASRRTRCWPTSRPTRTTCACGSKPGPWAWCCTCP